MNKCSSWQICLKSVEWHLKIATRREKMAITILISKLTFYDCFFCPSNNSKIKIFNLKPHKREKSKTVNSFCGNRLNLLAGLLVIKSCSWTHFPWVCHTHMTLGLFVVKGHASSPVRAMCAPPDRTEDGAPSREISFTVEPPWFFSKLSSFLIES